MDRILKVAKRLKTLTLDDIVMFCEIDPTTAEKFLQESENIKPVGNKFEYVETTRVENKFRIIDKNIQCKNSDITVVTACEMFLKIKQPTLTEQSYQSYKTFVYSKIIPYFKKYLLKDVRIQDIQNFRQYLQENKVSERRIKNVLALLNQIIKYFQNEGYIDKICVFEVKRIADILKRQIQILTPEQLAQLFKIKDINRLTFFVLIRLFLIDNFKFLRSYVLTQPLPIFITDAPIFHMPLIAFVVIFKYWSFSVLNIVFRLFCFFFFNFLFFNCRLFNY